MDASTTRPHVIASTLRVFGAGIAVAWKFAGPAAHADGVSAALDAPAQALAPAVRIQRPNRLSFPVQLPGDIVVLNNFRSPRTFGAGRHEGIDIGRRDQQPGHPLVACIDGVLRNQVIGTMGRTGNPNVPHLHFEARRGGPIGTPIDPFPLLPLPLPGVAVT